MESNRENSRKERIGVIVSNKMQKTVTVRVERTLRHPLYKKTIARSKKYYAHTDRDDLVVGQKVRIVETRPLSKLKCWRVVEVIS